MAGEAFRDGGDRRRRCRPISTGIGECRLKPTQDVSIKLALRIFKLAVTLGSLAPYKFMESFFQRASWTSDDADFPTMPRVPSALGLASTSE